MERKERKRVRRRGKGKKRKDRSSIQIARGIFFKALSKADPLCAAATLSWIIIIAVKGANEMSITYTR